MVRLGFERVCELMADRFALKLVGFIFAAVTIAVMLATTIVVKSYADGVYSLDSAPIDSN